MGLSMECELSFGESKNRTVLSLMVNTVIIFVQMLRHPIAKVTILGLFVCKNEKTLLDQRPKPHDSNFAKSADFSKTCRFQLRNHKICGFWQNLIFADVGKILGFWRKSTDLSKFRLKTSKMDNYFHFRVKIRGGKHLFSADFLIRA